MNESRVGDKNPMWKGESASYYSKHVWLWRHYGKANKCEGENCKGISTVYQWANISGEYKRDRNDFKMLCASCHAFLDKRKTHCPQGHEFTKENTYTYKRGYRACRTCWRIRDRKKREEKRNER